MSHTSHAYMQTAEPFAVPVRSRLSARSTRMHKVLEWPLRRGQCARTLWKPSSSWWTAASSARLGAPAAWRAVPVT